MNVLSIKQNLSFHGYDAIPLKGLYMQGLVSPDERKIYEEMRTIAQKEGVDLFVNENNTGISRELEGKAPDDELSIWAQDNKAFVENKFGKTILWNTKEKIVNKLEELSTFKILPQRHTPRGGNYFLGYNNQGEKWLIVNSQSIYDDKTFDRYGDNPKIEQWVEIFDVKPKNIIKMPEFFGDIDEYIRPIGYPYILINDYEKSLDNLEKMHEKFPDSPIYEKMKRKLTYALSNPRITDNDCHKLLSERGFIPIKIGTRYSEDINFINALAFKDNENKVTYITNSTKYSLPELEYLEKLFENDLKTIAPNIGNIYFVSGGEKKENHDGVFYLNSKMHEIPHNGFKEGNTIMNILATRLGGIHCMTAEIPNFEKLPQKMNFFKRLINIKKQHKFII